MRENGEDHNGGGFNPLVCLIFDDLVSLHHHVEGPLLVTVAGTVLGGHRLVGIAAVARTSFYVSWDPLAPPERTEQVGIDRWGAV